MKQHLYLQQIIDLSENFRKILYTIIYTCHECDLAYAMNIGNMTNMLYDYDCDVEMISSGKQWYIRVGGHINTEAKELCDALFEAIKIAYKIK